MESPPHKRNVGRDEDRISALTDDLLLGILERLDLHESVRAGALSTRWRHLPHRLSRLCLQAGSFRRATLLECMDGFTGATQSLLADRECDCSSSRAMNSLSLGFFVSAPHLTSIGRAVEHVVSCGKTKCLEFRISTLSTEYTIPQLAQSGQQFMSFSRAYQVAFRWLTRLALNGLAFADSDVANLISACDKLKCLILKSCSLSHPHSALKIDTPSSGLQGLKFINFVCTRIELISLPKLTKMHCHYWFFDEPPVRFGYVPELCEVGLASEAKVWQAPFLLSECLSRNATNLSKLRLNFCHQRIWIQPEHSKQLTVIFSNLTEVGLYCIFPECDLSWTLFILEAAPALQRFKLCRGRLCAKICKDGAEKTNVVWGPSKDFKHFNLKFLVIQGFEEKYKVTNYIRLVMELAVGLKKIMLLGELPCKDCNDCERKSQVDEASRRRVKEQLTNGSSSSLEIITR